MKHDEEWEWVRETETQTHKIRRFFYDDKFLLYFLGMKGNVISVVEVSVGFFLISGGSLHNQAVLIRSPACFQLDLASWLAGFAPVCSKKSSIWFPS